MEVAIYNPTTKLFDVQTVAQTGGSTAANQPIAANSQGYLDSTFISTLTVPINLSVTQTTITGTTAGSAVCSQPFQGSSYKKSIVFLNGYENTTSTAQTYAFPVAFAQTPYLARDDSGGASASTTTLTLPASMAAAKTGWVVVEGY